MDRKVLALAALLTAMSAFAEEDSPRVPLSVARANARGNDKVTEGQFEEAVELYRGEALRLPENGILQRNLAGALARAGLGEEALASYGQAIRFAGSREEQARVYFDLANTLALGGQYEPALQQYTRALLLNPADMDIKHNMEFLQRLMQDQEQQEQQQDGQDQDQEQQQQQQEEGQDQHQDQPDEEENPQSQPQQGEQEESEQQQSQPQEMDAQPMSAEDAQRLLDAMMEEEQEFQEMRVQQKIEEKKNVEKDW